MAFGKSRSKEVFEEFVEFIRAMLSRHSTIRRRRCGTLSGLETREGGR
jgi:hypothetical protein